MPTLHPHIHFNGNTAEAFHFYQSVLGGSIIRLVRFKELSTMGIPIPEKEFDKIMHITLSLGSNCFLTGSDVPDILGQVSENENRSKLTIRAESKEEADRLFNGLSEGGAVEMPIADSPWGSYFGSFRDKYGIEWMIEWFSP